MGNYELAREVVRTTLKLDQVRAIGKAFTSSLALGSTLLVELKEDYSSELLSVLADFCYDCRRSPSLLRWRSAEKNTTCPRVQRIAPWTPGA